MSKQKAMKQIEEEYADKIREADRLEQHSRKLREIAEVERAAAFRAIELMSPKRSRTNSAKAKKPVTLIPMESEVDEDQDTLGFDRERLRISLRNAASTKSVPFALGDLRPMVLAVYPDAQNATAIHWTRAMRWLVRNNWIRVREARKGAQGSLYDYTGGHTQDAVGA